MVGCSELSRSLLVQAEQDNGHPLPAFANLQIEVLDENNQAPYFLQASYHGYVSEASSVGTTVSAGARLSAPLAIVALDNDVEEVRAPSFSPFSFYPVEFSFLLCSPFFLNRERDVSLHAAGGVKIISPPFRSNFIMLRKRVGKYVKLTSNSLKT